MNLRKLAALCTLIGLTAATPNPAGNCQVVGPVYDAFGTNFNATTTVCNWDHVGISGVEFDVRWASIYIGTSSAVSRSYGSNAPVSASLVGASHVVALGAGTTWQDVGDGTSTDLVYVVGGL